MAENSKIEWCMHTANLWHGCTKVHAGCDHCYAETLSKRWKRDIWGNDKPRMIIKSVWDDLKKYQAAAAQAGEIHRVFVGSMMDIFEKPMPLIDSKGNEIQGNDTGWLRDLLFQQISAGLYNNLMFLFLTKRPSNINKMIPPPWLKKPPENVMFGTSPVNQETADKLIPQLLQVNGKRFLSVEPMLGQINLHRYTCEHAIQDMSLIDPYFSNNICKPNRKISWVICGGESGNGRRPFNTDWAYSLQEDCEKAAIPFFMKQIDKVIPIPEDLQIRQFPVENS